MEQLDQFSNLNLIKFDQPNPQLSDLDYSTQFYNYKEYLVYQENTFFMIWNLALSVILTYQIIMLPYDLLTEPSQSTYPSFDLIFEFFYIYDIIFSMITVYYDEYGNIMSDLGDIMYNYLSFWFIIDAVSSIPVVTLQTLFGFQIGAGSGVLSKVSPSSLKILKLPKTIRGLNVFKKLLQTGFVEFLIDILDYIGVYNIVHKYQKFGIIAFLFLILCWVLVCCCINLIVYNPQYNWFKSMIQDDYSLSLDDPAHAFFHYANYFQDFEKFYGWFLLNDYKMNMISHRYLYAWYFVFQTVTTVGYGDVSSSGMDERLFRIFCMFIGTLFYSALSASIVELVIFDNIENTELRTRNYRIKEIVSTYNLKNDPRKVINYLSTSVYEYPLYVEYKFIDLLPERNSGKVFDQLFVMYNMKILIMKDKSFEFFLEIYKHSKYRKCIENEVIVELDYQMPYIYFVYSGKLGVKAPNLDHLFDSVFKINIGEDFGYNCFLEGIESLLEITCLSDTEILCLRHQDYVDIYMNYSGFNNVDYIVEKVEELMADLFMMLVFNYFMIKLGLYVDYRWLNRVTDLLAITKTDKMLIDNIIENIYTKQDTISGNPKLQNVAIKEKWYSKYINPAEANYITRRNWKRIKDSGVIDHNLYIIKKNTSGKFWEQAD